MPKSLPARIALLIAFCLTIVAGAYATWLYSTRSGPSGIISFTGEGSGTALVGGPFELLDQDGQTRRNDDFLGSYMLIYFGYTYCPDFCPTTLNDMSQAIDLLGRETPEKAALVTPIFITVDPDRDTVEALADYAQHFHERLVALTGSTEQVGQATKAYRIYSQKVEDESASSYLMDHTSIIYLMGPKGEYLTFFPHGSSPESIADGLKKWATAS
jgi:cytochrome oxidase Cu insertion factor (SCO1/SenC/PrrC family)